jgi:hypothetical protein
MTDTPKMTLAELKAAMATFTAAELKAVVKEISPVKHTMLSLTYDVAIAHELSGKGTITDNIATDVTKLAREYGILGATENADQAAIKARLSFAKAYDAALGRAGLEIVRKAVVTYDSTAPLGTFANPKGTRPANAVDVSKPNGKQQHRPAA